MDVSYVDLRPGGIARTVEVTPSLLVDTEADGTVLGVEVIGGGNWLDALAALAMQGRLRVARKPR